MDPIKQKFGLSTDAGTNYQSVLYLAMGAITQMEAGHEKSILMALCLIALAVVSYMTRGYQPKAATIDNDSSEDEILKQGRE